MMFLVEATALRRCSLRAGPNHRALGPDPHLQHLLPNVDLLHQELDDARLFGGEQLVPDRGEVGKQDGDLALGDLVLALPLRRPGTRDEFRRGQQLLHLVGHGAFDIGGRHAGDRAAVVAVRDRLAGHVVAVDPAPPGVWLGDIAGPFGRKNVRHLSPGAVPRGYDGGRVHCWPKCVLWAMMRSLVRRAAALAFKAVLRFGEAHDPADRFGQLEAVALSSRARLRSAACLRTAKRPRQAAVYWHRCG